MKHPNTFNEKTNEVTGDKKDIKCQVQKENMYSFISWRYNVFFIDDGSNVDAPDSVFFVTSIVAVHHIQFLAML